MNTRLFILPALCLGGTALLLAPVRETAAFSTIGGSLGKNFRDVRVFDNFLDATSNNNTTPSSQFPGWVGLELAIWKGVVEWGSQLHGDGTGDPPGGNQLGSGGANFDPMWSGNASGPGGTNDNIVSSTASCGGSGTLAFTETPISNGWRIIFCDEWTWQDGPGSIGGGFDIQGVMCHEYGHALGLGHSTSGDATMFPSVSSGSTAIRSISADDIAGVQFLYGVADATKPTITATVASGGNLTIYGANFDATGNEVWFTNADVTSAGSDPIVRVTGVDSSAGNAVVSVSIPANAAPGDVMVNTAILSGAGLSNAFPTDLTGAFGTPPSSTPTIASISPSTIDALIPGLAQTITITGTNFDLVIAVLLDGGSIDPARYTIVNPGTITLDMPQASSLGVHDLGVSDGVVTVDSPVTIVVPTTPKYEVGNGEPLNVIDRDDGLRFIMSGVVGRAYRVVGSSSDVPSVIPRIINLGLGNRFAEIWVARDFVIPASGWVEVFIPTGNLNDPGPGGLTVYSQIFGLALPYPLIVSNLQSNILVR